MKTWLFCDENDRVYLYNGRKPRRLSDGAFDASTSLPYDFGFIKIPRYMLPESLQGISKFDETIQVKLVPVEVK